ncbi:MAG: Nif3-like dinuclear metal center hexameric protein, partial [Akkermansia sp.]|nr:Nif3-like dinuclear metal center hexameric protein [Akkermansia sp.]MBP9571068.1 Nif3-like dinuclear metal center hexameric protein [Akkermansia sp.]
GTCAELEQKLETVLGAPVQAFWKDSPEAPAGDVFICTGGAGDDLAQAAALGCRTYVTGEGSHWNIPLAQELGVNLVFGGHYFTETFGVKALGLLLKDVYGLDYTFIDLPPSAYSH